MKKRNLVCSADDTIAAISTPLGEGGIGIVRLSGKKALSIADRIFVSKDKNHPSGFKTYTVHYGHIFKKSKIKNKKSKNEIIDEVILTIMKAPKSYTKEDVVEINCHGGVVPLRKVLDLVLYHGARLAEPGEFTKRAFINGRIDLTQAEAVLDVIRSRTDSFMKIALGHLEGGLSDKIRGLKENLLSVLGEIEACIDFSEEDIELASKDELYKKLSASSLEIKELVDDAWKGMILKEGVMCVICGKPNVGKSSLMNVLLRRNRVIVTPIPGTTRDAVEEIVNMEDIPIRLVDTAGISKAKNVAEEHGIQKSKSYIRLADIILFMLDSSKPWSGTDEEIIKSIRGKNVIAIANKTDLPVKLDLNKVKKISRYGKNSRGKKYEVIEISLLCKKNLDKLERAILGKIWRGEVAQPEGAFVTNLRHRKELESAHKAIRKAIKALGEKYYPSPEIAASDLREAVFFLDSVLGEAIEPDILDRIFSRFCVGK